jgi:hypothetical protein
LRIHDRLTALLRKTLPEQVQIISRPPRDEALDVKIRVCVGPEEGVDAQNRSVLWVRLAVTVGFHEFQQLVSIQMLGAAVFDG